MFTLNFKEWCGRGSPLSTLGAHHIQNLLRHQKAPRTRSHKRTKMAEPYWELPQHSQMPLRLKPRPTLRHSEQQRVVSRHPFLFLFFFPTRNIKIILLLLFYYQFTLAKPWVRDFTRWPEIFLSPDKQFFFFLLFFSPLRLPATNICILVLRIPYYTYND